jgi:hypothetical protein
MELQRTTEGDVGATPTDWNLYAAVAVMTILAGGLHFAAAWIHRDLATLSGLFVVAALLQIGWGVALLLRPPRGVVIAGGVMNALFVVFYVVTRFTSVGIEGLDHAQPVELQDLVTTLLEAGAAVGALALVKPALFFGRRPARLGPQGLALVGCLALVLAGPAFAADGGHGHHTDDHDHLDTAAHEHAAGDDHAGGHAEGDDHGHADGEEHAEGDDHGHAEGDDHGDGDHGHAEGDDHGHAEGDDHGDGDHGHAEGAAHGDDGHGHAGEEGDHGHAPGEEGHEHAPGEEHNPGEPHPHPPGPNPHPHPPGPNPHPHPPGPGPHPHPEPEPGEYPSDWTDEQVAFADRLIATTETAMLNYNSADKATAAGFSWIGDGAHVGGYQHWINLGRFDDGRILDPDYPESLVFKNTGAGLVLEAAMFILPWNYDVTNIPPSISWLPGWHKHDDLCFTVGGKLVAQVKPGETCPQGSILIITPPMLHVWIVDTECGRFAGVDGGGLMCEHEH